MKTIKYLIGIGLLLAGFSASAQLDRYSAPISILSSKFVAGAATSNYTTAIIDGRYQENIALELTSKSAGTNANSYTVSIQRSIDGSNWDTTTAHMSWALTANGTNSMRHLTNLVTLGYGYFRVASIANANPDTVLTNIAISYTVKR